MSILKHVIMNVSTESLWMHIVLAGAELGFLEHCGANAVNRKYTTQSCIPHDDAVVRYRACLQATVKPTIWTCLLYTSDAADE